MARIKQRTGIAEALIDLGSGQQWELFPWEDLFRRTDGDQHEFPARFSFDPFRKAADPIGLSLEGRRPQLDDKPLVSSTGDQVRALIPEKRRKSGPGGLDKNVIPLGPIFFGDPLDSLPPADQRIR
jgi:hypothetical protein